MDIELKKKLYARLPDNLHQIRKLPGGGDWMFVPWRNIRRYLDYICPDWNCQYSDPVMSGEYIVIRCKIIIQGISREGVGSCHIEKNKFGSPVEKASAEAFKNAAENFGVCAYLHELNREKSISSE